MPELRESQYMSLAAITPDERGPAVIYAAFESRPLLAAIGWSPVAMRGFHPAIYDTTVDADRRRMDEDMRADGIGARDFDFEAPFIARLELFRTPVSPEVLLADFGIRPLRSMAHVSPGQTHSNIQLCAAFPAPVLGFDGQPLMQLSME